jgi:DNA-binding transcriptional LysR family regulator
VPVKFNVVHDPISLSDSLGVKLLDRTTRYVRVTEAGRRYLEDARQLLAGLEAADEAAAGINAEPRGHLAVTAPVMFGRLFVMPGIVEYLERYPAMEVDAVFLDRSVGFRYRPAAVLPGGGGG